MAVYRASMSNLGLRHIRTGLQTLLLSESLIPTSTKGHYCDDDQDIWNLYYREIIDNCS